MYHGAYELEHKELVKLHNYVKLPTILSHGVMFYINKSSTRDNQLQGDHVAATGRCPGQHSVLSIYTTMNRCKQVNMTSVSNDMLYEHTCRKKKHSACWSVTADYHASASNTHYGHVMQSSMDIKIHTHTSEIMKLC